MLDCVLPAQCEPRAVPAAGTLPGTLAPAPSTASPSLCRGVYDSLSPGYRGRCTAPLLVDLAARRIVCNESSLIVRSLNALRLPGDSGVDLAPQHLLPEIERWNDRSEVNTVRRREWERGSPDSNGEGFPVSCTGCGCLQQTTVCSSGGQRPQGLVDIGSQFGCASCHPTPPE